jgi:hypothetical protein
MRIILKCRLSGSEPAWIILHSNGGRGAISLRLRYKDGVFLHDPDAIYKDPKMNIELNQNRICLNRNQLLKLCDAVGHAVVCDSGGVWVTQEGDQRDIFLKTGQSFTLDRDGPALVQAFDPASITIRRPEAYDRAAKLVARLRTALAGAGFARGAFR